jgi:ribosomal protein S18 acetylase RimI-like enzyme
MNQTYIRTLTAEDVPQVMDLQLAYARRYPGAAVVDGQVYLSPAFEQGANVFCAFDPAGHLQGYSPLYPVYSQQPDQPHTLWTEIRAYPDLDDLDAVKDRLYAQMLSRALVIAHRAPGSTARLAFQYTPAEIDSIEYVRSKGFSQDESIYRMSRDLRRPIVPAQPPAEVEIRRWSMAADGDLAAYVAARNEAFPAAAISVDEWRYFLSAPFMQSGVIFGAFAADEPVGSATVFWSEEENRHSGQLGGYTEYIFVRPAWQGRGIARALVTCGMQHLLENGLEHAHLEVRARHAGALDLYISLGFQVVQETCLYTRAV